jgi:hypothetical protein
MREVCSKSESDLTGTIFSINDKGEFCEMTEADQARFDAERKHDQDRADTEQRRLAMLAARPISVPGGLGSQAFYQSCVAAAARQGADGSALCARHAEKGGRMAKEMARQMAMDECKSQGRDAQGCKVMIDHALAGF